MPETFNFTARATAASGAFADRAFSITVNNSLIQRLLAVGASGAARSLGAGQPWVFIPGVKGNSADYGDRWLVWDQTAGVMWSAPDLINWGSFVPTFPSGYSTLGFLRWRAGAWWAVGYDGSAMSVMTSVNGGQTWTLVGGPQPATFVASFERSEAGVSVIANEANWYHRANDAAAWVAVKAFDVAGVGKYQIAHLNGVWFGPARVASIPGLARSADGAAWFDQSNPTVLTLGYYRGTAYANGVVLAYSYADTMMGYTTDAGQTLQPISPALPAASTIFNTERPIVSQGGRFVFLGAGGNTYLINSVTGPSTTQALPAAMGAASCLAVRL